MTLDDALAILSAIPEYRWIVNNHQQFWTSAEVAEHMGFDARTINKWCEDGRIPNASNYGGRLSWRIPRSSLIIFFADAIQRHEALS